MITQKTGYGLSVRDAMASGRPRVRIRGCEGDRDSRRDARPDRRRHDLPSHCQRGGVRIIDHLLAQEPRTEPMEGQGTARASRYLWVIAGDLRSHPIDNRRWVTRQNRPAPELGPETGWVTFRSIPRVGRYVFVSWVPSGGMGLGC